MNITVILCTYNRCTSLARALESVAASILPESTSWQVLVVDNNSKDQTPQVVHDLSQKYPGRFRYLFEGRPGKSNALNSGIAQSEGELIAFMDDDVVVEPTWLQNLTVELKDEKWAGAGGRILPEWLSPPPKWLPVEDRYGLAPLAGFDLGPTAGPLTEAPFGTNMVFRRDVFTKYAGFRTDLGPRPDSEIRNEDTEFGERVLQAGENLLYEPSAVVWHSVSQNRIRKEYFLKWWFDKARADVRQYGVTDERWTIAGVSLVQLRRLVVASVRWLAATQPSRRFGAKLKVWGRLGEIHECYRRAHSAEAGTIRGEVKN